jgi:hypothetical protein
MASWRGTGVGIKKKEKKKKKKKKKKKSVRGCRPREENIYKDE